MITEQDLREAIAECEGTPKPNASTCIKLAAFYTILQNMMGDKTDSPIYRTPLPQYSMASEIPFSDSDFSHMVENRGIDNVFPVIDELMETLMVMNPRLYDSVMRKIENI